MNPFLSHIHAELRRARITKRGATHRAADVPRGTHKVYPRMEQLALPAPRSLQISLTDAIMLRQSAHGGNPEHTVSLHDIGTLLGLALGTHADPFRRHYPSGGELYPIETYLISTAMESQEPGVYHYNPTKHALERLWNLPDNFDIKSIAKSPALLPLSSLIVFTSVWARSSAKYGDLSYQHALLEAGHMSENILLIGGALGLAVRPYAGFNDERIEELLDLESEREQTVHTITLCAMTSPADLTKQFDQ